MSEASETPIEFSYLIGYVYRVDSHRALGRKGEWFYDYAVAKNPAEWFIEQLKESGSLVILSVLQITEEQVVQIEDSLETADGGSA